MPLVCSKASNPSPFYPKDSVIAMVMSDLALLPLTSSPHTPCSSSNTPGMFLPQDICINSSLYLDHPFPK